MREEEYRRSLSSFITTMDDSVHSTRLRQLVVEASFDHSHVNDTVNDLSTIGSPGRGGGMMMAEEEGDESGESGESIMAGGDDDKENGNGGHGGKVNGDGNGNGDGNVSSNKPDVLNTSMDDSWMMYHGDDEESGSIPLTSQHQQQDGGILDITPLGQQQQQQSQRQNNNRLGDSGVKAARDRDSPDCKNSGSGESGTTGGAVDHSGSFLGWVTSPVAASGIAVPFGEKDDYVSDNENGNIKTPSPAAKKRGNSNSGVKSTPTYRQHAHAQNQTQPHPYHTQQQYSHSQKQYSTLQVDTSNHHNHHQIDLDSFNAVHAEQERSVSLHSILTYNENDYFFNRPSLAKYLFVLSAFLVVCSLGLAAAGLGMMYSAKAEDAAFEKQSLENEGRVSGELLQFGPTDVNNGSEALSEVGNEVEEEGFMVILPENNDGGDDGSSSTSTTATFIDNDGPEFSFIDIDIVDMMDGEATGPKGMRTDVPTVSPIDALLLSSEESRDEGDTMVDITLDTTTVAATVFTEIALMDGPDEDDGDAEEEGSDVPEIELDRVESEIELDTSTPATIATANMTTTPAATTIASTTTFTTPAATTTSTTTSTTTTTTAATTKATTTTPTTTTDDLPQIFIPGDLHNTILTPIADTWLEYNHTAAFGAKKRLKVDGQVERITLLKFNMSSLLESGVTGKKDIVGARLRLFSLDTDSPFGGKIDILGQGCNFWEEHTISWNNAPKCVFHTRNAMGRFGAIPANTWNEAVVQLNFNILPPLITLRVTSHLADGVTYASRESGDEAPELVVHYTLPQEEEAALEQSQALPAPTRVPTDMPSREPSPKVPSGSPILEPTRDPSEVPTYNPTIPFPTYSPTNLPTMNGTHTPTASPSTLPQDLTLIVSQDAMIRGNDQSNKRYGTDPFLALRGANRRVVLEFDLSPARPKFEYAYTLQLYITYVGSSEQRSVLASYVTTPTNFQWDESTVTWNSFFGVDDPLGMPETAEIGWFSIYNTDSNTRVEIPLGRLPSNADGKIVLVLENIGAEGEDMEGSKFDFRSGEFGSVYPQVVGPAPPTLIGVPQFDE